MKIAIVSPLAQPLVIGGAENLWWGLQNHIHQHTEHSCDIVSVPSPEGTVWDLMRSYETFSRLDLSHYDCVISGKYPAWMVRHDHHVCYMLHRLRGLYDTYQRGPVDGSLGAYQVIQDLIGWMNLKGQHADTADIAELFQRLEALKSADLPDTLFTLPGSLARAIVHFLDNTALGTDRIARFAAISQTVAERPGYFPADAAVSILHPPPHRDDYHSATKRHLFTSSRLDGPKRVSLIVEAMQHVQSDIPLLIAGTGPQEAALKKLAEGDDRVRFLGYVPDQDMPKLYAEALAVPFVPADEDYGLVAVEAMRSAAAVVTCRDSGGPVELVRDGETGFVADPTPESLGAALSLAVQDVDRTQIIGRAAREEAQTITWARVADGLLQPGPKAGKPVARGRPKITVATTFPVFPPMNGGQARVFHLYRALAKKLDIDIVSLGDGNKAYSEQEIAPGLVEIRVPRTVPYGQAESEIMKLSGGKPIGDILFAELFHLLPDYMKAVELSALTSGALVACHPYVVPALKAAARGKPLWYEAQDVEASLKAGVLAGSPLASRLQSTVQRAERAAWLEADLVYTCTEQDRGALQSLYGPTTAHCVVVPNGVALDTIPFAPPGERRRLIADSNPGGKPIALFLGSWHGPNLEAVEHILEGAAEIETAQIVIAGSVGLPFKDRACPDSVTVLGTVSEAERDALLHVASVALNPMTSGSGSNLKMLDYMAAGLPVVSTQFGARGLGLKPDLHYVPMVAEDFATTLDTFLSWPAEQRDRMAETAREHTAQAYGWATIAETFHRHLTAHGFLARDGRFDG